MAKQDLTSLEWEVYNEGERLIPGRTHDAGERMRHEASYLFFRAVVERDLASRKPDSGAVSVVDLGCGVGHGCYTLATLPGLRVTGVDTSRASLDYAQRHYPSPSIEYRQADLRAFVPTMSPVDYVLSRGVMEHVPSGLDLIRGARWASRLMFDVPYDEAPGNPHHLIHRIVERDFAQFPRPELFYQDLAGVIYDAASKPRRPNMIICACAGPDLPPLRELFTFPLAFRHTFSRDELIPTARCSVRPTGSVLDIGCGLRPQAFFKPRIHICCEPHGEYVDVLRKWLGSRPDCLIIQAPAMQILPQLAPRSVDSVFLLDLIEHLEKDEGRELLRHCERVAREQVVLFTPLGWVPQDYEEGETDGWGLRGTAWQTHRSGWVPEDFDSTWQILECPDFHTTTEKGEPREVPAGAFWAIKNQPRWQDAPPGAAKLPSPSWLVAPNIVPADGRGPEPLKALFDSVDMRDVRLLTRTDPYAAVASHGLLGPDGPVLPEDVALLPEPAARSGWSLLPLAWHYLSDVWSLCNHLIRQIRELRPRLVLVTSGDLLTIPALVRAAQLCRVPALVYLAGEEALTLQGAPGRWLAYRLHRYSLRRAAGVITTDAASAQRCQEAFGITAGHPGEGQSLAGLLQRVLSSLPESGGGA